MGTAGRRLQMRSLRVSRWSLLLAVPTAGLGLALAWLLARPDRPELSSTVRALADCLGAVALGLALLNRLQDNTGGRPPVARTALWRPLAVVAGFWAAAELALLVLEAADVDDSPFSSLGVGRFAEFVIDISAGQVGAAALVCALLTAGYAAAGFRSNATWSTDPIAAIAALALMLRPITGHMSQQTLGALLGAAHALSAALWFGLLATLALMLRTRSDWAKVLPRYSDWALRCVVVLMVTGVVDTLVRLGGIAPLFQTGYGRIAFAKFVLLVGLMALGWWWRRSWVGQAGGHRLTADDSLRRAVIEVVTTAAAFGLAAALATTA